MNREIPAAAGIDYEGVTMRYARLKKNIRSLALLLCAILTAGLLFPVMALAEDGEEKLIRVGWYESGNTARSTGAHGYDYEYLQALSQYTGWSYEYVHGTWDECLSRLENGEIDILGFVSKTDEREKIFAYPNLPMAVTNAWLVVGSNRSGNIAVPESLEGMTAGVVAGNAYNADLDSYCIKNGINMKRREYSSLTDISTALSLGEIDVAVVSDEDMTSHEHRLVRLSSNNQYYATGIKNEKLLSELDEAMMQVHTYCPYLNSDLYQRYLNLNLEGKPSLTSSELAFIENNPTITVLIDAGWPPVEYYDETDGAFKGIFPDLFDLISEKSGLKFAYEGTTSGDLLAQMAAGERKNLLTPISWDYGWAEQHEVYITQPFVSSQIVKLGKALDAEAPTAAINKDAYFTYALREELKGVNTLSFPKQAQRLEAVRTGEADYTFVTEDQANYYRSQPKYADLKIEKMLGYEQKVCICIGKNSDPELMSIISKTLASVTHDEQTAILRDNTMSAYEWTLSDFLYA